MSLALAFASAVLLGSIHALEPDHMAAVTAFAVRKPAPFAAASFGMRWAMGHGVIILIAGVIVMTLGLAIPAAATPWLDRLAGLALITLGVWTSWYAARLHAHAHSHHDGVQHVHMHSHALSPHHEHGHAPTLVGAMHGLAGAAPAIALLQMTRLESVAGGIVYLLSFAIGTAIGMAAYALVAGYLLERASARSLRVARAIGNLTGVSTVVIGVIWLIR